MATITLPTQMAPAAMASSQGSQGVREVPLKSSWLESMRYDPQTFQLSVTTKKGAQYTHFYVFPMTIDQMIQHPSPGQFYSKMIKGKHPSIKVTHKSSGPVFRHEEKGPIQHERRAS